MKLPFRDVVTVMGNMEELLSKGGLENLLSKKSPKEHKMHPVQPSVSEYLRDVGDYEDRSQLTRRETVMAYLSEAIHSWGKEAFMSLVRHLIL